MYKYDVYASLAEEMTHITDLDVEVAQNKEVQTPNMYYDPTILNKVHRTNLARQTHLPSRVELLTARKPQCVVCTTKKIIGMTLSTPLHIHPLSKSFMCAIVTCALRVQCRINLNSKWQLIPKSCGKAYF